MADCDDSLEIGVPAAYYDTWNRHNSIAFCNYKGLRNAPGENNCFLNSAVQVFWHLDVFRRSYRRLTGHTCMGNSCIFCALKAIFTQFQYSDQSSLPPDTLRKALAETFVDDNRFQLGHMDDAAECFENILRRIHLHLANDHNEDTCTAPHCLSHQKFAMTVFDQLVCPCGAKTDPLRFHEMVHYISASALVSQAKQMQETGDMLHPDRFGLLLRNAAAVGDVRDCPGYCGKRVQIRRTLLNCPDVVSIGLIWDSERPNGELITDVARSLGTTIMLQDVFHSVMCDDVNKLPKLHLVALVCYYGKHYSTFVFHSKLQVWIYFDDATVREIGPRWEDVVQKCVRSRYQPLLLLYTNPRAALLPVDTAPKKTTMQPGYKFHTTQVSPEAPKSTKRDPRAAFAQQRATVGRRAVTPGPEMDGERDPRVQPQARRAVTPGPEHYSRDAEREHVKKPGIEHHRHNSFLVAMSSRPEAPDSYNYDVPVNGNPAVRGNRSGYPDGNPNHRPDSRSLMGEYVYHNGSVQPSFDPQSRRYEPRVEDRGYTENGYGPPVGETHRAPVNNYDSNEPQVLANGITHASEVQRKESFKKGNRGPCDVIRYIVDQPRATSNPAAVPQAGAVETRPARGNHARTRSQGHEDTISVSSETNPQVHNPKSRSNPCGPDGMGRSQHGPLQSGLATLPRKKPDKRPSKSPSPTETLDLASQVHERQGSSSSTGSVVLNPKYHHNGQAGPISKSEYMDQRHFIRKPQAEPGALHSRQASNDDTLAAENHHWRQVSTSSQGSQSTLTPSLCDSSYQDDQFSHQSHSRQLSSSSQQSNSQQPLAHPHQPSLNKQRAGVLVGGAPPHHTGPPEGYICRNMVEKLFARQGLQRQTSSASSMSVKSNTSSSSIESDLFIAKKSKSKGGKDSLSVEIPYDSVSLESQKDSGYGSSDRNSSSSTSSITMDPFSQYFLSRSMIPPKTVNDYAFMQNFTDSLKESIENMEKEDAPHESPYEPVEYKTQPPNQYTANYVQQQAHQAPNVNGSYGDPKYPPAVRQTAEYNKGGNPSHHPSQHPNWKEQPRSGHPRNESPVQNGNQIYPGQNNTNMRPGGGGNKPPNSDLINFQSGIQVNDILPGYNEVMGAETDEFLSLCHKAEELMDSCMLAETSDDNNKNALNYCNTAIAYLNHAMNLPDVSQQSWVFAQRKHNSCVMKYRSLQKRSPTNLAGNASSVGSTETLNSSSANRSSMTSTDSDGSQRDLIHLDGQGKTQKDVFREKLQDLYKHTGKTAPPVGAQQNRTNRLPNGKPAPPQRTCSVASSAAVKQNGDNMSQNTQPVPAGHKNPNIANPDQRNQVTSNNSSSISRFSKQGSEFNSGMGASGNSKDAEIYQAYLNRQKALSSGAPVQGSQTSSGTSTPTSSVDGSEGSGGSSMPGQPQHVRYSKAEIRHLLQQNMMQRHSTGNPGPAPVRPVHAPQGAPVRSAGRPDPSTNSTNGVHEQSSNLVRPTGAKIATIHPKRTSNVALRGPKPQIACKPPVISDSQSKGMIPKSVPSSMPPSDYQTREFVYGVKSRPLERCSSQPDCNNLYDQQQQQACHADYTYLDTTTLVRDRGSRSTYSSQPDLTSSGMGDLPLPASLSAPSTPAHSCENLQEIDSKPSVKDIASRFEATMGGTSTRGIEADFESVPAGPHRQRSKSESSSGPKPVLKRRKKSKSRGPRKSVTFSDSIALIAASEQLPPGPAPPPYEEAVSTKCRDRLGWDDKDTYYGYDSDDDIVKVVPAGYADDDYGDRDSCASTESGSEVMCTLCRKKGANPGVSYCNDCEYYMSRFQPNR